jgi:predicted ATPase/class 3 adenylate cyclase
VHDAPASVTYLFSDIEGSTRLWEQQPELMRPALARHDAVAREAIARHHGTLVKMTGDGVHAAFADALDAVAAVLDLQQAIAAPDAGALPLHVRSGLHAGSDERRDNDFFGPAVNRAARIMSVAHGGQVLVSQAVADVVRARLPADVSLRDLGYVRLRDLANPERLYQVVHPRLRADFPALRSLEATPNNLAQQLNSFIGRERETAEVKELLHAHRLVTLLGMGGIGKSRLSVQLGAEVLDDYPDGVWLVELAPLSDPRLVPQAVASVLGVKEEPGRPVAEALVRFVRDRQLLIILDNCEHVVHACAELAKQLLQAGPKVKVLASSRDYLQVAGEAAYPVPTLSAPDPTAPLDIDSLRRHASVRLLVDRIVASAPKFRVTQKNAAAVADICHRLDGIPLALELAAARARALPIETIAARLNDRFRLLVTGDQTVLPRQRTLRALIDWSYDLLDAPERALFQRLAVFAGGFTLEAAEEIGAGGGIDRADVMDLLAHLVEKSLVVAEAGGERYRLLDTVRHYAQERLAAAGEEERHRTAHLHHYVALAETARPQLAGPDQGTWLARLDAERENLLAAHAWGEFAPEGARLGLRLVHALRPYWLSRGLMLLGLGITREALARVDAQQRNEARCRGLSDAGLLCCFMGRYGQARELLTEAVSIAREIDNVSLVAGILQPLGMACIGEGDKAAARAHLEEALELARRLGNKRELAAAFTALAQLHRMEGRLDEAEPLYESALPLARELGDQEYIAAFLLNLSMVSIDRGALARVPAMLLEVLGIAEEIGSKPAGQSALDVCAGLAAARGEPRQAALFYGAAEAQMPQTGLQRDPVDEAFVAPRVESARAALGEAAFAEARRAGGALGYADALAAARTWLAGG